MAFMRINAFFFSEVNLNQDLMLSEPQYQGVNLPERHSHENTTSKKGVEPGLDHGHFVKKNIEKGTPCITV